MESSRKWYVSEDLECWQDCHGLSEILTQGQPGQNRLDGQQRWCLCSTLRKGMSGQGIQAGKMEWAEMQNLTYIWCHLAKGLGGASAKQQS